MRPTPEQLMGWHQSLRAMYGTRNSEFAVLKRAFDGDYVATQQTKAFPTAELDDRKKLVYNMNNSSIRRYMDEMSAPVRLFCPPADVNQKELARAERRQKLLTALFKQEKMTLKIVMAAYHQGLMDKAIFHVRPDPSKKIPVCISLVRPDAYYPIPLSGDFFEKKGVIFAWQQFDLDRAIHFDPDGKNDASLEHDESSVLEYWDAEDCLRLEAGKETFKGRYPWGFVPFVEAHNIPIPFRQRGQGDIDQTVGLNEHLNNLMSDQADVLSYMSNPIVVVRGAKAGTQNLIFGPRAVWELERDAGVEFLTWAGSPPSFETQILRVMQGIEDATGLSSPAYGREIPSGVSGEAIRSILAGFNTRIGAKQTFMGVALADVCNFALAILEAEFPKVEIRLPGEKTPVLPEEIDGEHDAAIIFMPQNETVRVFTELELMRNGVQSRLMTMRKVGIVNPEDEYDRIAYEKQADAYLLAKGAAMAGGLGGPGGSVPAGVDPNNPQGPPVSAPKNPLFDKTARDLADRLRSGNAGTLEDLGLPPGMGRIGAAPVDIRDIIDALDEANLQGKVFAEGELADEGRTEGPIRLRVTDAADAAQVRDLLGPLAARVELIPADAPGTAGERVRVAGPGPKPPPGLRPPP